MAPPYEPRASGSTRTSAKAVARMADTAGGTADAPSWRHLLQRPQHEVASLHLPMRHVQRRAARPVPASARPQQYIQVEHPASPATSASAAEADFDPFEQIEQGRRIERRADDDRGIGKAARRGSERRGRDDRGMGLYRQSGRSEFGDRPAQDSCRRAEPSVPPVRAEPDRVEM